MAYVPYDDGNIACDETKITIRRYYPWFGAKKIPYSSIRSVRSFPLAALTGKWRIFGSGDLKHWWNFDSSRPSKSTGLEINLGRRVLPTITPDDAAAVERIIGERAGH
jgi:hypothetical protein